MTGLAFPDCRGGPKGRICPIVVVRGNGGRRGRRCQRKCRPGSYHVVEVLCYSQRMLNPFHGIMSVVKIPFADAVSTDGLNWILYVWDEELLGVEGEEGSDVVVPDIKYGTWSPDAGLQRAPVRSTQDYSLIQAKGDALLEAIKANLHRLPFPLQDRYELWLLDSAGLPLALVDSRTEAPAGDEDEAVRWNPGRRCRAEFRVADLDAAQQSRLRDTAHADALAARINGAAEGHGGGRGAGRRARWLERDARGGGVFVHPRQGEDATALARHWFPPLLLRAHWEDALTERLVRAFHAWQAPWLLLLGSLTRRERAALEPLACRQAARVAEQFRLYPAVVDEARLTAARVQAVMGRSAAEEEDSEPEPLSPFYLEL